MDFEQAKTFLSQQTDGHSLYNHLSDIVRKILDEKPENALELFENISIYIKESQNNNVAIQDFVVAAPNEQERRELLNNLSDLLQFYGKKILKAKKQDGDEDEEDNEEENNDENEDDAIEPSKIANIFENYQLMQWAGLMFTNQSECYQLQQSITKFIKVKAEKIESSRFFGKIQAVYNDYWILECKLTEYPEPAENKPANQDAPGIGANEYVYFVTTQLSSGRWEQLPDANPSQIKQSRNVTRLLSGNLSSKVCGQTFFDGQERDLLRCQIARIISSCTLSPASYYNTPEEEDEDNILAIELNEEFEGIEDATSLESWVHQRGHLRLEGCYIKTKSNDEDEDNNDDNDNKSENDENNEKKIPSPEELEEQIPILQSISNDTSKALKVKFDNVKKELSELEEEEDENDDNDADNSDESQNTVVWHIREINKYHPYCVISIQNKLWPGHYTLHLKNSKNFVNIYIGNGLKYQSNYYIPQAPDFIVNPFKELIDTQDDDNENGDNNDNDNENDNQDENDKGKNENQQVSKQQKSIFDVIQEEVRPPAAAPENPEGTDEVGTEENED